MMTKRLVDEHRMMVFFYQLLKGATTPSTFVSSLSPSFNIHVKRNVAVGTRLLLYFDVPSILWSPEFFRYILRHNRSSFLKRVICTIIFFLSVHLLFIFYCYRHYVLGSFGGPRVSLNLDHY